MDKVGENVRRAALLGGGPRYAAGTGRDTRTIVTEDGTAKAPPESVTDIDGIRAVPALHRPVETAIRADACI
jgi:hypothetical protein